jgi:hypothetical protein
MRAPLASRRSKPKRTPEAPKPSVTGRKIQTGKIVVAKQ